MSNVLVIAAHPDDEVLGVGGTVIRHVANADPVFALILGEGQTSRWEKREDADPEVIVKLHQETLAASNILGYTKTYFADFPDNRFDTVAMLDIVKCIEKYIRTIKPEIIYTHHGRDLNIDHQLTFQAVLTAVRPLQDCTVKEIYTFETVSSTEWSFGNRGNAFCPNVFVDIEPYAEQKYAAMKKYESELCQFPHPRSLEMLNITAKRWGAVVGRQRVEAFELIRKVI